MNLLAALATLPPLLAVASPQLGTLRWSAIPALSWAGLAYSAVVAYTLTNLLWFVAVEQVGTARASVFANLQPFLGAVFALAILSETVGPLEWLGGGAIAAGIILSRTGSARLKPATPRETRPESNEQNGDAR